MEFCNETEMREYLEEHNLECSHYTVTNFGVYANVKEDNMLNISVNITPEQLVNSQALGNLAKALCELSGAKFEVNRSAQPTTPQAPVTPQMIQALHQAPATPQAAPSVMQQVPVQQVPVQQPAVQQAPSVVPTVAPAFNHQQLAIAAMQLKDLKKLPEMQNLLTQFGVAAITQLPQEQLPAFAQGLQALGVKL